jgi:hypothetical protein
LAALRVGGEQLTHVLALEFGEVRFEGFPGRALRQDCRHDGGSFRPGDRSLWLDLIFRKSDRFVQ